MIENKKKLEIFKKSISITTKTITNKKKTEVNYVGQGEKTSFKGTIIKLKEPSENLSKNNITKIRGTADSVATQVRYHNTKIHKKYSSNETTSEKIFDSLEKSRCNALGSNRFKGIKKNITDKF